MRTLPPAELLQVWERGTGLVPAARALLLLGAACIEDTHEQLAALPIGERDTRLLELRTRLFGNDVDAFAKCPECETDVETQFRVSDLIDSTGNYDPHEPLEIEIDDTRIRLRVPNSTDLLAVHAPTGPLQALDALLERCVLSVTEHDSTVSALALTPAMRETVIALMEAADPRADARLALTCPACAHAWSAAFDIVRFLWRELHVWALRMLRDIDVLARTYHWSEPEILALSPRRRQAYIEICLS